MILVRQRREAHAGLLEVERALLRFGAGEGWGADRLRAARLARRRPFPAAVLHRLGRSEEHTSELQSLMRISYAVFCLKKKNTHYIPHLQIHMIILHNTSHISHTHSPYQPRHH